MSSNPTISVIIPTYNRAGLISETLESVLNQSFTDFELIVVDDGSTDHTSQVLERYGDRIRQIKMENSGQGPATNKGIMAARGEYLALIDSDDLWEPYFLEETYKHLKRHPEYDFSYCNYRYFEEDRILIDRCIVPEKQIQGSILSMIFQGVFICSGSYLIKKEHMIEAGMFDPQLPVAKDWDLWFRIAHRFTGTYLDKTLLKVRNHGGRISNNGLSMALCNLTVLERVKQNYPRAYADHKSQVQQKEIENHRRAAYFYRKQTRPLKALTHYLKAGQIYAGLG